MVSHEVDELYQAHVPDVAVRGFTRPASRLCLCFLGLPGLSLLPLQMVRTQARKCDTLQGFALFSKKNGLVFAKEHPSFLAQEWIQGPFFNATRIFVILEHRHSDTSIRMDFNGCALLYCI